jgi:hypothetical protein
VGDTVIVIVAAFALARLLVTALGYSLGSVWRWAAHFVECKLPDKTSIPMSCGIQKWVHRD